jgi:hypothetical protein
VIAIAIAIAVLAATDLDRRAAEAEVDAARAALGVVAGETSRRRSRSSR